MSPFLTAKALDAPLLKNVNSAAGSVGIVDEVGETQVKLGSVEVHQPSYESFDKNMMLPHIARDRMGIAEADRVVRPRKGARFSD